MSTVIWALSAIRTDGPVHPSDDCVPASLGRGPSAQLRGHIFSLWTVTEERIWVVTLFFSQRLKIEWKEMNGDEEKHPWKNGLGSQVKWDVGIQSGFAVQMLEKKPGN